MESVIHHFLLPRIKFCVQREPSIDPPLAPFYFRVIRFDKLTDEIVRLFFVYVLASSYPRKFGNAICFGVGRARESLSRETPSAFIRPAHRNVFPSRCASAIQIVTLGVNSPRHSRERFYWLFSTVCGAGLLTSSCALTFCRPAVNASICFCWRAMVAPCSCTTRCSLRNSFSNIAFTAS